MIHEKSACKNYSDDLHSESEEQKWNLLLLSTQCGNVRNFLTLSKILREINVSDLGDQLPNSTIIDPLTHNLGGKFTSENVKNYNEWDFKAPKMDKMEISDLISRNI